MSKYICLILLFTFLLSCNQKDEEKTVQLLGEKEVTSALIEVNKSIVKRNRDHINIFIKRTGWDMQETETGIWFGLLKAGIGPKVEENDIVHYEYIIRLIDGTYPKDNKEIRLNTVTIGKGGVVTGLEKGLLLMSEGDSARIIIPPYLGHGNFGNNEDIPPGAILIYDLKLSKLNKNLPK